MYKIVLTEKANADLSEIVKYIAQHIGNPFAANALLDEIEACYGALKFTPEMYERCRDSRLQRQGYRKAVIKHYIMIYRVDTAKQCVYIMRFFYGARDYEKLI